jgi:hypothetical protein
VIPYKDFGQFCDFASVVGYSPFMKLNVPSIPRDMPAGWQGPFGVLSRSSQNDLLDTIGKVGELATVGETDLTNFIPLSATG